MKDRERREEQEEGYGSISIQASPFLRWLDNFWYHYKWHTIGIAFALIVVLVCTLQTCSKESYDIKVVYAGPVSLNGDQVTGVDQLLDLTLPEDFDGDGEKNVSLIRHTIYSKEQIEEIQEANRKEIEEKGEEATEIYINTQFNSEEYDSFYSEITAGASAVYLIDPWLYEELRATKGGAYLRQLYGGEDALLSEPVEGLLEDGYGVRLGETALYREYKVFQALPEDTVICLLAKLLPHGDEMYENSEAMLCALVKSGE